MQGAVFVTVNTDENTLDTAGDLNASPETLLALAKDEQDEVRYEAAKNRNTPAEALRALAKYDNEKVRQQVEGHPKCKPWKI